MLPSEAPAVKRLVVWSVIGTGISSIAVQLVTVREFLTQFHGNEITISLVLFCWLLLTGLGSLLAKAVRRARLTVYVLLTLAVALWPLPQILLIRSLRDAVFIHGSSPGFYEVLLYILGTTGPYGLLVGFILPYALAVLKAGKVPFTSGDLYVTDSAGDITGGILFSFVLVYWTRPFAALALSALPLIIAGMLLLRALRRPFLFLGSGLAAVLFGFLAFNVPFETGSLKGQYGDIQRYLESPYGRIVVTKEAAQHTFWESGLPLYSSANVAESEEKIHYPLSQLDRVERVLLVSGGLGETLGEVFKYRPSQVHYVELDPYLTATALEMGVIREIPGLKIINADGRAYIKDTAERYDAIVLDLPEPDTFQINRFFTAEFFSLCKRVLRPKGILSFSLACSPNYISDVEQEKLATMYHTALRHFEQVRVLPGERAYFLCRDGGLSTDIPSRLKARGIETSYVAWFYAGNVTEERIRTLQQGLEGPRPANRDFEPRMMRFLLEEWFRVHGTSPVPFVLALLVLTGLYLAFLKKEEYVLFSTGLTTMGVEMLVVFCFQVMHGYIYLKLGAVVTAFLLGLLPGALMGNRLRRRGAGGLLVSEGVLLGLLFLILVWLRLLRTDLGQGHFLLYCLLFSLFCGFQFPVAAGLIGEERSPAAGCLAADLAGAALGTLAVGTLLIPLWGMTWAIIFLILVKVSSSMIFLGKMRAGRRLPS